MKILRSPILVGMLFAMCLTAPSPAYAGPRQDAQAVYERGLRPTLPADLHLGSAGFVPLDDSVFLTLEVDRETDGRFIADVPDLPGILAYGVTE